MYTYDVYQGKVAISVPRDGFVNKVVLNENLSKKDLRVACMLLAHLSGFDKSTVKQRDDPMNFTAISPKMLASELGISKEDVKKSMDVLVSEYIIEEGSSNAIKKGYRFTF